MLIYLHADADAVGVEPVVLAELATALRDEVVRELTDGGYTLVDEPGPGVLRIRAALADVGSARPVANVGAKIVSAVTLGAGFFVPVLDVGRAAIEVEMRDAATGERMIAFLDARQGRRYGGTLAAASDWGRTRAAFREWAAELRRRLDATHRGTGDRSSDR